MTNATSSAASDAEVIRVVIADDHAVVRDGLRALMDAQRGLKVVGEARDGQEALQRSRELEPDVLLIDLSMPGVNGANAIERVTKECPRVRVLVLTMHEERGYVSRAMRGGAAGYVLKRTASAELVRAVRAVAAGGTYVDPSLATELFATSTPRGDRGGELRGEARSELTAREAEVLRLVARGYTNKEVAAELEISIKTVETHKANGMTKLGLTTRAALVRFAMDEQWLRES